MVVVGAGPAGCSTALHAAQSGLKVLVLEEHPVIGEPVHCGECFSDFALKRMGWSFPSEVIAEKVKGVRVIFPGNHSGKLAEPGYVLRKEKFEQWVAAEAGREGAEFSLGKKVVSLKRDAGGWGVGCADGSEYQCRLLVDASGPIALSSRLLGLNQPPRTVVGLQYLMEDVPTDGYLDFYLWPELAPHGYLWMIPKGNGKANVGLVTNQNAGAKKFLDEFVRRMGWQGKKITKSFGGVIPASGPLPKTYGDGLLLVGDAAGFASPVFEGGTSLGLMSGKFAAIVAKKALEKGDLSEAAFSEYEALWKKEFPDYLTLVKGKDAIYDYTDAELEELGEIMPSELADIPFCVKAKFALNVLLRHRSLLKKDLMGALKAFGYSKAEHYGW